MKIHFILICIAFVAISSQIYAQNPGCDQLQSEVEYLKKVLKMQSNPVYTDLVMGVELKILSVVGSKRSRSFQIDALFTSPRTNKSGRFYGEQLAIDPDGQRYVASSFEYGNGIEFFADVPTKIRMTFDNINPDISIIKMLKLNIIIEGAGEKAIEYRNVKIDWQ